MEHKLEITKKLGDLAQEGVLDTSIAVLNLPGPNYCEKRKEMVYRQGELQQACKDCVTKGIKAGDYIGMEVVKEGIDFFSEDYRTRFITINGRGDPFHKDLKQYTIDKILYAREHHDIQSYVFTAGNNLDEPTCRILAKNETNVLMSWYGNQFLGPEFFAGKVYPSPPKPLQNQRRISENYRTLIGAFRENRSQPEEGTTRIGLNYVVSERDLADGGAKVTELKQAANDNGIFFLVNTDFNMYPDLWAQRLYELFSLQYSDFHQKHSTGVNGQCQMGAGSSITIDFDGTILRCPYLRTEQGDGKFQELSREDVRRVADRYMEERSWACIKRRNPINFLPP